MKKHLGIILLIILAFGCTPKDDYNYVQLPIDAAPYYHGVVSKVAESPLLVTYVPDGKLYEMRPYSITGKFNVTTSATRLVAGKPTKTSTSTEMGYVRCPFCSTLSMINVGTFNNCGRYCVCKARFYQPLPKGQQWFPGDDNLYCRSGTPYVKPSI